MKPLRVFLIPLALLLGPGLLGAQEPPLAAGSDGVPVPKKKKHVQPVYPQEALAEGIRGIVILDLVIDTEGRVVETTVIRSIPGLDAAALAAVRQWRYSPVKVDGQPVSVRLTVPITFALKLPEMTRDRGIPELRQGVTPPWPMSEERQGGSATADVTLDPDGRIGLANIIEGTEPWSTSLLRALRTWRFRPPREDASVSFRVEAEFVRGSGRGQGTVRLRLTGLRESQFFDAPADELAPVAALEPVPESGELTPEGTQAPPPEEPETPMAGGPEAGVAMADEPPTVPQAPAPGAEASPGAPASPAPGRTPEGTPDAPTPVAEAQPDRSAPAGPEPTPEETTLPGPATPERAAPPAGASPPARASGPGAATAVPPAIAGVGTDPTAPPPVEVITAAPPPPPPENGISAIRGVQLEPGVPDLTRGRRPVSPPFARMAGVSGVVEVEFSVSAGGVATVQRASGPELLQTAAKQAVESWVFRRTRADRAYLTAVFTYEDDLASAIVRPQPPPE